MAVETVLRPLVGYLQQLAVTTGAEEVSDRRLLEQFARDGSEAAFRQLVKRHAVLVYGVCQRATPCVQDAEDCFQATFLLLACKAGSVRWHESVAGWLHQVATRLAAERRVREARRRRRERQAAEQAASADARLGDVAEVVDEELERLPERCRAPLLLCYLQGQSREQAAAALGLSLRTLERRLQAGKTLLRDRLVRRGLTLSAAVVAWQLTQEASAGHAGVVVTAGTAALAFARGELATVPGGAAELARDVLHGWLWARVRGLVSLVLTAGLLVLGGGAWLVPGADEPARAATQPAGEQPRPAPVVLREAGTAAALDEGRHWLVRHQQANGSWKLDAATANDTAATAFGLLPLLAAAESGRPAGERFGPYTAAVRRGLTALAAQQQANGGFPGGMYAQGLATAALCEGHRRTGDPALKPAAQRALDYIVKAQHAGGGWRYAPGQPGDTSVTAWQVLALDRGVAAGLAVPQATLQQAGVYLNSVSADGGATYGYTGPMATNCMTAAGLHCRYLLGWPARQPSGLKGAARLKQLPPAPGRADLYYYHYATRAMHRIGGPEWDFWEPRMAQWLLDRQEQAGAERGSWPTTGDPYGSAGGRLMMTSLALLTLEPCGRLTAPHGKPTAPYGKQQAAADWEELLGRDLTGVRAAMQRLTAAPGETVPLLQDRLRPQPAPDGKRVQRLIGELDSEDFNVRSAAMSALEALGEPVAPALRRALKVAPSLEARRRLEQLLDKAAPPRQPARLRQLRAVQVLELIGVAEARAVLEALVRAQPETPLADAARQALRKDPRAP